MTKSTLDELRVGRHHPASTQEARFGGAALRIRRTQASAGRRAREASARKPHLPDEEDALHLPDEEAALLCIDSGSFHVSLWRLVSPTSVHAFAAFAHGLCPFQVKS